MSGYGENHSVGFDNNQRGNRRNGPVDTTYRVMRMEEYTNKQGQKGYKLKCRVRVNGLSIVVSLPCDEKGIIRPKQKSKEGTMVTKCNFAMYQD